MDCLVGIGEGWRYRTRHGRCGDTWCLRSYSICIKAMFVKDEMFRGLPPQMPRVSTVQTVMIVYGGNEARIQF